MDDVEVIPGVVVPADELEFRYSRSGGPGGQNVNKRETRVELLWDLSSTAALDDAQRAHVASNLASRLDTTGRLRIVSSEERTQAVNRDRAVERLRELLVAALKVEKPRRKTRPSKAAKERRLGEKRARSQVKQSRSRPAEDD